MSLDIYLMNNNSCVFESNLTHNLAKMASEADLYKSLWRCDEYGITVAKDLIEHLEHGLLNLVRNKEKLEKFNPENGWGSYNILLQVTCSYLSACHLYPEAKIELSR
jgi:hypothetical protein